MEAERIAALIQKFGYKPSGPPMTIDAKAEEVFIPQVEPAFGMRATPTSAVCFGQACIYPQVRWVVWSVESREGEHKDIMYGWADTQLEAFIFAEEVRIDRFVAWHEQGVSLLRQELLGRDADRLDAEFAFSRR